MRCPNGHESAATDYCDTCGAAMDASETLTSLPGPDPAAPLSAAPPATDAGAAGPPVAPTATSAGPAGPVGAAAGGAPSALDLDSPAEGPASGDGSDPTADRPCPNCGAPNAPDALFCEVCGYDHTTGNLPRRATADSDESDGGAESADGADGAQSAAGTGRGDGGDGGSSSDVAAVPGPPANASKPLVTPWVAEIWIDPGWYASQGSPDPLPSQGPPVVVPLRNASLLVGRTSTSRGIHPDIECGADNGVSRRHAQLTTDGTRWWVEDLDSSNGTYIGDSIGDLPTKAIPPGQKREVDADDRIYLGSWTRIVLRPSTDEEIADLA